MKHFNSVLCMAVCLVTSAQLHGQKKASASRPVAQSGSVAGRVFGITQGGDLKPARLARVYLLYSSRDVKDEGEETGWQVFMRSYSDGLRKLNEQTKKEDVQTFSERLQCRRELLVSLRALDSARTWAAENKKGWQLTSGEADEDGWFAFPDVKPGRYMVVARGRSGVNDAEWESDLFPVKPREKVTLKLSAPNTSCLALPVGP